MVNQNSMPSVGWLVLLSLLSTACMEASEAPETTDLENARPPTIRVDLDPAGIPVITWDVPSFEYTYAEIESQYLENGAWGEWYYSGEEDAPMTSHVGTSSEGSVRYRVRWNHENNMTRWVVSSRIDIPCTDRCPETPSDPHAHQKKIRV